MRARLTILAMAAWVGSGAGACGPTLEPPSLIDRLRLLAVRAEPAQGVAGTPVRLDALVVQPESPPPAPVDWLWFACVPAPGASDADVKQCAVAAARAMPPPGPCDPVVTAPVCLLGTMPTAQIAFGADAAAPARFFITTVVARGSAGAAPACLGRLARAEEEGPDCVVALRALDRAAPGDAPNQNPGVRGFSAGGATVIAGPALQVRMQQMVHLTPIYDPAGASEQRPDGAREALTFSWFATAKDFDHFHSGYAPPPQPGEDDSTTWTAQPVAPGVVHFWVVVRDDRGGVGWTDGAIEVTP